MSKAAKKKLADKAKVRHHEKHSVSRTAHKHA
jgi:hypothetical protein